MHVLVVLGSPGQKGATRVVVEEVAERLKKAGAHVDLLDFQEDPLPLFNPETSYAAPGYAALQKRVARADVLLLATPDYHGCMSSTLKNFLDHFWKEYAGKLMATLVGSYDKGLTVTDQLRTAARQCYAWTLPYGVVFADKTDVLPEGVLAEGLQARLDMLTHDMMVYGTLLARQREADLAGSAPGFLARYRS